MHKFIGRTPGTSSTLPRPQSIAFCGSPPSTPRLSKTISLSPRKFLPGATPSNSAVAPYIARKNLRTLATSPTKSLRCAAPRIHSSFPPTTMIQSLQASVKSIPRWPPLVEPAESLKPTLPLVMARSRLSPLRPDVTKRPIPQKMRAKLSPGREKVEHHSLALTSHVNVSLATKPSARDLGKRRGVIMMEKLDIEPNTHKQKVVENTVIVPTTGQIEFHKIPVFYPSTSEYAVATKSDPVQIDSSVGTNARNRSNNNENIDDLISELDPAPNEPLHANACASLDLSKIDTQFSNLVDSMSDSNLGSLEMTQNSDSDSEMEYSGLPTVEREPGVFSDSLNALPAFCRTLLKDAAKTLGAGVNNMTKGCNDSTFEGALQSTFDVSSFSRVNSKGFPSASLISATFGHRRSGTSSSSGSSSRRSSEFLFSRESPIRSISAISPPLFGLTKHYNRSSNTLSRQDINKKDLGSERLSSSQTTLPAATHGKKTSVFSKLDTSCLQSNVSTSNQTSNPPTTPQKEMEEKEDQAINPPSMSPKRPAFWNEKVTRLPMRSKPNAISDQTLSPSPIQSVPESELCLGQNISNESLSPKVKPTSVGNPSSCPIVIPYLALNRSHSSQFKPRSNTIHTHLSSPSRSLVSGSLVPPSPPTKPRSNTVNTYSPINRSPLSQHVMNNSVEFQSRLNDSKTSPSMPLPTSHQRTSVQKLAASKLAKSISKSIPLRVTKSTVAGPTALSRPSPPTAAFMVPNKPISTGRRTGSSVAPLIPNCPTSSNGVISPSQCRSLLRNSLSMVR
ncbi:hypothetical protein BDN70DRAFT_724010 [Pholiota conissans]|uniref:Uncharacterized protein n=1 Tax=Pholiota conissans TaxID=109636 RepID=A0A9P5Z056_9AGAR|nr:hypothetical protein BDN70DRAFT_724010 [Pholiota conissans]